MKLARILVGSCLLACLVGCSSTKETIENTPIISENKPNSVQWWTSLADPLVDELVLQLHEQNIDIKIAKARVAEARGVARSGKASLFPQLTLTSGATRSNTQPGLTHATSIAQGGFDTTWELDIFGGIRAGIDGDEQRVEANIASIHDVTNSVVAELLQAIVSLRQSQQRLTQTQLLLDALQQQVELLAVQVKGGLTDAKALKAAESQYSQTAAHIPIIHANLAAHQHQIERLIGRADGALELKMREYRDIMVPEDSVLERVTIDIIRQRPDIRAARASLLAANADLTKAEAALWPSVNLANFFGVHKGSSNIPLAGNPIWSIAASVSAPILEFGLLRGAVDAADARARQAELEYENAVLTGLEEARTALADYLSGLNAIVEQQRELAHDQEALDLSQKRFTHGLVDMLELSAARIRLQQGKLLLVDAKAVAALAYIRLQKAIDA